MHELILFNEEIKNLSSIQFKFKYVTRFHIGFDLLLIFDFYIRFLFTLNS